MAIYRGPGGSGDAVNDASSETRLAVEARDAAIAAQAAAEAAQAAAELAETNAETAETNAETAETNAETAATAAQLAETNAETAQAAAEAAQTAAETAQTAAELAETNAETAETNAETAQAAAEAAQAAAELAQTGAETAETNAETAQAAAEAARDAALSAYDNFDDRYLGPKSSDPTLDNDGNALVAGALYFNTATNVMKVYDGSAWVAAYVSAAGVLLAVNNLSDLNNTATARTNLGVAIGTDVQAYDADTAKLDVSQSWSAAQAFNAGVTLGDASGDALTINSSAVSIPNGLNFDSNTFVIDATNNRVGIGTSSPAQALHVVSSNTQAILEGSSQGSITIRKTGTNGIALFSNAAGTFAIYDNDAAATRLTLSSSGNLGLGVTPSAWTLTAFQIKNCSLSTAGVNNAQLLVSANSFYDGSNFKYIASDFASYSRQISGQHQWFTAPSGTAGNAITFTQAMTLDASGRLLVGATTARTNLFGSASAEFQVEGLSGDESRISVIRNSTTTATNGGSIILGASKGTTLGSNTIVASGDRLGGAAFLGADGTGFIEAANIAAFVDGTPGTNDMPGRLVFSTTADGASIPTERMRIDSSGNVGIGTSSPSCRLDLNRGSAGLLANFTDGVNTNFQIETASLLATIGPSAGSTGMAFKTANTERMRIDSSGNLLVAKTSTNIATAGSELSPTGDGKFTVNGNTCIYVNRLTSDGTLVDFRQAGTSEGTISVSGTTVSYNGGHLARWSQLLDGSKDDTLLKGTVLTNLDEMCQWTKDGEQLDNEQLNKMKVSDVEGDTNVAGVFVNWTRDEDCNTDDMNIAMTGDMIIRIAQGVTVNRGDLLMSAGDGTAKPQGDDIVRSKTIAKVTSTNITCTYTDGSYCVPCVLMAC